MLSITFKFNSIQTKMLSFLVLFTAIFLISTYLIQRLIIYPEFVAIERKQAEHSIQQVIELLNEKINNLDRRNFDLSAWDETYDFVDSKSQEYIDSNLGSETFVNYQSSFFYVLNLNKDIVWGDVFYRQEHDSVLNDFAPMTQDLLPFFYPYIHNIEQQVDDLTFAEKGLFAYHNTPILFSIQPILKSDSSGPKKGYLAQGQFLDRRLIEELKDNIKLDFKVELIQPQSKPLQTQYSVVRQTEQEMIMATDYHSNGKSIIRVSLKRGRSISQQGSNIMIFGLLSLLVISAISMGLIWLVIKNLVLRPLNILKMQMTDISKSKDYSQRAQISSHSELGDLSNTFNEMLSIVESRTSELEATNLLLKQEHLALQNAEFKLRLVNEELKTLSVTDPLTGVANRLAFEQKLHIEWLALRRAKKALTLFMIDIDYFKNFNDYYGHQLGDQCIQKVATLLAENLKRPTDLVARYGGEEFILILPDTEPEAAIILARQIHDSISEAQIAHANSEVSNQVTISIGISSVIPEKNLSWDVLIKKADEALYRAKNNGRNKTVVSAFEHS